MRISAVEVPCRCGSWPAGWREYSGTTPSPTVHGELAAFLIVSLAWICPSYILHPQVHHHQEHLLQRLCRVKVLRLCLLHPGPPAVPVYRCGVLHPGLGRAPPARPPGVHGAGLAPLQETAHTIMNTPGATREQPLFLLLMCFRW